MPKQPSEYVAHVLSLLELMGDVSAKAMFGGWGLYKDGLFFGLIVEDQVYFRTDDVNRSEFAALGLRPWVYERKAIETSYYEPPDKALDDGAELCRWGRSGLEAARRNQAERARKPAKAARKKSFK